MPTIVSNEPYTTGWVYNLREPNARTSASRLIATAATLSAIACLAIMLRFYVRLRLVSRLGADDFAALSSMMLGVGYSGIAIYQTRWGQALEPAFFPPENLLEFSKIQFSGGPTYCLALLGFKLSLLFSYIQIAGHNRRYRIILYTVTALVTANQIAFTLVLSFACRPIAKQWDASIPGHCIDAVASYFGLAGSSLGFDIIIITLPFPLLHRLQLDNAKKVALACLIGLGFFVTIIQIIRIFTIANLADYTNSEPIISWSIVEINLGVIISSIPTYGPLYKAIRARIRTRSLARATSHSHSSSMRMRSRSKYLSFCEGNNITDRRNPVTAATANEWDGGVPSDLEKFRVRTTAESWPRHWPNNHDNADAEYHEAVMGNDIWVLKELIVDNEGGTFQN